MSNVEKIGMVFLTLGVRNAISSFNRHQGGKSYVGGNKVDVYTAGGPCMKKWTRGTWVV